MNAPVVEGEVLAGKYRIERVLGRGGMGVVVAAMHTQLNQRVAIKLLLPGASADVTERFLREARAAVRLKSEHVARVIDVGELATGAPYMVMEYLEGQDLSQRVRSGGALPVAEAVEYLLHACEAIAEAHAQGIVHRDLKPANLFLTSAADGTATVKVLDFGISKASADADEGLALTKTTAVLGSPLYMSPEQMKWARGADARSDIWSLGAILYELLAAAVPFNAGTFSELVLMANMNAPPPLSSVRPDVPPELEAAVLHCLEKAPANRFQNVADLAWAIVPFGLPHAQASAERASRTLQAAGISSGGPQSLRAPSANVAGSLTGMSASTSMSTTGAPAGRGKTIVLVAAALALGGAAMFLALGRSRQPDPPLPRAALADSAPAPPAATAPPPTVAPATASVAAAPPPEPSASAVATTAPLAPRPSLPARPAPATPPPPTTPPVTKKSPLQIELK